MKSCDPQLQTTFEVASHEMKYRAKSAQQTDITNSFRGLNSLLPGRLPAGRLRFPHPRSNLHTYNKALNDAETYHGQAGLLLLE